MKIIQFVLACSDKIFSKLFRLQAWGTGDDLHRHEWIHFVDVGPTIGIAGADGKIRTMMGYWSVRHYYDGAKLLKRIPVRKDLKEGERRATAEEVRLYQAQVMQELSSRPGMMFDF